LPWHVFTDASGSGIGALLCQKDADNQLKTVDIISRRLSEAEKRYSTSERELLAIVFALKKWRHLVDGGEIFCFTDHKPLVLLKKTSDTQGRIAKWLIHISALNAKLIFYPGKLNVAADALSRLHETEEVASKINPILIPVKDEFGVNSSFLFNNDCFSATIDAEQFFGPYSIRAV